MLFPNTPSGKLSSYNFWWEGQSLILPNFGSHGTSLSVGGTEIKQTELIGSVWTQADWFPFPSMFQRNAFSPVTHLGFGLFRVDLNHCSAFRITVWPRLRGCRAWWICVSCTSATTASKSSRDWRTMWAGSCWLCDGVVALSCSR